MPTAGIVTLLMLAVLMAYAVFRAATKEEHLASTPAPAKRTVPDAGAPDPDELKGAWNIDYTASHIKFTGMDSGVAFDGEWPDWTAAIHFESMSLNLSSFDIQIMTAAVETGNDDRDQALQLWTWFDSDNYPAVLYQANQFANRDEGGYVANGHLTVKGKRTLASLDFTVSEEGGRFVLDGETVLDRIALEVGLVEFLDTRWIGQFVTVYVHVEADGTL